MPTTDAGQAIASRHAWTLRPRCRLPSLGEDPEGYRLLEAEWMGQLPPRTLLERHYVEKIAAASWRLRRLHRRQAQLFEDDTLTESDRSPSASAARTPSITRPSPWRPAIACIGYKATAQAVTDLAVTDLAVTDLAVTDLAVTDLATAPLDTCPEGICKNELPLAEDIAPADIAPAGNVRTEDEWTGNDSDRQKCEKRTHPVPLGPTPRHRVPCP